MIYGLNEEECKYLTNEELNAQIAVLWQNIQNDKGKWSFDVQEANNLLNEAKRRRKACDCGRCETCREKQPSGQSMLQNFYPPG